ncbi:MAG: hypothetical protein VX112_03325 [Pseudomonadota bacterium]|nr:hypothetical protein [Pseudomonadota bacterium]
MLVVHKAKNYLNGILGVAILVLATISTPQVQAQNTGNFILNVFYQNQNRQASCGQSNDTKGFDLAKRHGWIYSGYLFHMLLNGLESETSVIAPPAGQDNLFGISECDDSYCYMQRTFGYMPGLFYVDNGPLCSYGSDIGTSAKSVSNLMLLLNYGLFSVMMILTAYAITQGVLLGAAQEGSLTQKLSLLSATRICVGAALIVPQPDTGYSTIQVLLMYVIMMGVGLADRAFSGAVDAFLETGYVFTLTTGSTQQAEVTRDTQLAKYTKSAFEGIQESNIRYEGYTDLMRRMVCSQYQVYSRMLRQNNTTIQNGLASMSFADMPLELITKQTTEGDKITVTFGDQQGVDSYPSWCGTLEFPVSQQARFNNILRQFNQNTFILFKNAIDYARNYRLNIYKPGESSMETKYTTCLRRELVTEYSYIKGPSLSSDGSTTPTCAASNGQAPTFTQIPGIDCSDPGLRPAHLNLGSNGVFQGEILQPLVTRAIAWQSCSNQSTTVKLGAEGNEYSGCISDLAQNLSNLLQGLTNDFGYDGTSEIQIKEWMLKSSGESNAGGLRNKSVISNGDPSTCKSANASCYEYDINQIALADSQNATTYTGDQYDLVKAYRLIDPALEVKSRLGDYAFNNIREAIADYNTPATTTQAVNPMEDIDNNSQGSSALDVVTKNLLGPLYNDFDSAMKPQTGYLLRMMPDWFPPSVVNFKQSIFMVLERLFGFYYFNDPVDEKQYFNNWFEGKYKNASTRCTKVFASACGSTNGCFQAMKNANCIRNGGLLGAANSILNQVNYNPFSDFVQTGITIMRATGYYIMYNNIDLFIANAAASAIYFGMEVGVGLAVAGMKMLWENFGPSWMQKTAVSALEIPFDVLTMMQTLDLSLAEYYTTLCNSLIFIMLPFGFMMGILIPFYPILIFVTAVFGWFAATLEGIIAAPLIAIGLAHPSYHDVMGKSTQSVLLMFSLFLQPIMLVFGVFVSIILLNVMIIFFNSGFLYYLSMLFNPSGGGTSLFTDSNSDVMILITIGIVYVYTMMIWEVTSKSCMVMVMLNDRVMRWMDSNFQPQSGAQMAQQLMNAAKEGAGAVGSAAKSGLSAVNEKANKGASELAKAATKVLSTIPNAAAYAEMKRASKGEKGKGVSGAFGRGVAQMLTVGKGGKRQAAVFQKLRSELGDDAKNLGQLAAPHAALGKAMAKAESKLGTSNLRSKASADIKVTKLYLKHINKIQDIKNVKAQDAGLKELKERLKDKKEDKNNKIKELKQNGENINQNSELSRLNNQISSLEESVKTVENMYADKFEQANQEYSTAVSNVYSELRDNIANADPRRLSDVTGPDSPDLGKMTVGEMNRKIVDMIENKDDTVIQNTEDMVAARAAGYSWDEIFAKFDDGQGNIGIDVDDPSQMMGNKNIVKMVTQAAKVKVMKEGDIWEGGKNPAFSTFAGKEESDRQLQEVYTKFVRDEDGNVNEQNIIGLMNDRVDPSLLKSIGLSAQEVSSVARSGGTSNNYSYSTVDKLVEAGYGVQEIRNAAWKQRGQYDKTWIRVSEPDTRKGMFYGEYSQQGGFLQRRSHVSRNERIDQAIADKIINRYSGQDVRIKVFNPLTRKMVTAKYHDSEAGSLGGPGKGFFKQKFGITLNQWSRNRAGKGL